MDEKKLGLGINNQNGKSKKKIIKNISGESKDKGFSVKTTKEIFNQFTKINKFYGMSNNSVINQLMVKYIRENQNILEEE